MFQQVRIIPWLCSHDFPRRFIRFLCFYKLLEIERPGFAQNETFLGLKNEVQSRNPRKIKIIKVNRMAVGLTACSGDSWRDTVQNIPMML